MNGITRAIERVGLVELAGKIGVTHQALRKFERNGIPAGRVLQFVKATGGEVTPYELRPDIYPDPDWLPPNLKAPDNKKMGVA